MLPSQRLSQKTPELSWTDLSEGSFSPLGIWLSLVLIPKPAHLALQECQDCSDKPRDIRRSLTQPSLGSTAQRVRTVPIKGNSHPMLYDESSGAQGRVRKSSVPTVQCLLQRHREGRGAEGRGQELARWPPHPAASARMP